MAEKLLDWSRASLTSDSKFDPDAMILRVPAFVDDYAAPILKAALFDSLRELDRERGSFNAQVTPGKRAGQDWESAHSTAGELLILAVRLAERFEPKALRERLEILAASAVQQGDTQQAGNTRRAQEFLDALAGDTAKSQDKSEELVDQEEQGPSGHDAEG